MGRADGGRPGRAKIGQFRLQAFHFESKRRSARKNKRNRTGRGVRFGKLDGQEIEDIVLLRGSYVLAFAGQNALETQGCPTPTEFMIAVVRTFPVETIEPDDEPLFPRPPVNIGNSYHRVLQMGRRDLEVFLVKDHEFECVHGAALPASLVRQGCRAAQDGQAGKAGSSPAATHRPRVAGAISLCRKASAPSATDARV